MTTDKKHKICLICKCYFIPHYKVKDRQKACEKKSCQWLRQKLYYVAWLGRNPRDYKQHYQDYGKKWQANNPDYFRQYRSKKKQNKPGTRRSFFYEQITVNGEKFTFFFQNSRDQQIMIMLPLTV